MAGCKEKKSPRRSYLSSLSGTWFLVSGKNLFSTQFGPCLPLANEPYLITSTMKMEAAAMFLRDVRKIIHRYR
jgi:hypothetical protein